MHVELQRMQSDNPEMLSAYLAQLLALQLTAEEPTGAMRVSYEGALEQRNDFQREIVS